MAIRHRHEKTASLVAMPNNGYVQQPSSKKNQSETAKWWKLRPHVALEWDAGEQKVVSKREQVGISWRHLSSYSQWGHHNRTALADVVKVPAEIFELKDLKDVLSLEAWNECLSGSERQLLCELLPKDVDREDVVRSILSGDNFHFGNPLSTWGSDLCKGVLHPDSVQERDSELKNSQKEYYLELQSYHSKMLESLRALKELWASCKNSEKEITSKLQSWAKSKAIENHKPVAVETPLFSQAFKQEFNETSTIPGEKEVNCCKSEVGTLNEDLVVRQRCKRRKIGSLQDALERTDTLVAEESKRNKPMANNSLNGDGCTEIMYTLKVSRKQYADILSLKESGEELQLDSLSSILGDSQKLGVHRINCCDKKDTLKIRQWWSMLVEKDMPTAHATFLESKAQKETLAKSIAHELPQLLRKRVSQANQRIKIDLQNKVGESTNLAKTDHIQQYQRQSNTSASTISSRQNWPGKHTIGYLSQEASLGADAGKPKQLSVSDSSVTGMEGQLGMQATVDSCMSSADVKHSPTQQSVSNKHVSLMNRIDSSSHLAVNHFIPVSLQAEKNGRPKKTIGEGEGMPMQGRQHFLESNAQKDTMVGSEGEIVSEDDEVSAIKNIWSSADLDTQELHSQNGAMPTVKEVNSFISRKDSNIWDSHSKPVSEVVNMGPMQGGAISEEVEQRISFQAGNLCTGLDTHLLEAQGMPAFQSRDQLLEFSRHNSFLRHQDPLSNGHGFYPSHASKTDSSSDKQGLQHHDHRRDNHHRLNGGYQSMISVNSNKFPQVSDLPLRRGERHADLFQMDHEKLENEQKQRMLLPKFLEQKSHSDGFLSVDTNSSHARLASPAHTLQSRGRQGSLSESSQPVSHMTLTSQSGNERTQQNHGPIKELRLLADDRSAEQPSHLQQPESIPLRTQNDLSEHQLEQQMMRHHRQLIPSFPFRHQLQQNQQYQHPTQDLYSPCTISPMLPGWPDSQQMSSGRTAGTTTHFGPSTSQWNVGDDSVQGNWAHMEVVPGPFTRGKNEDRRLPNTLSHWDQLSQNPYILDNVLQKHGQYVTIPRTFSGASYPSTDDCQGFQGHDDWACVQPLSLNHHHQYSSSNDRGMVSRGPTLPWMNVPTAGSQMPHQISHYEQQALQDRPLTKTNSQSWECLL